MVMTTSCVLASLSLLIFTASAQWVKGKATDSTNIAAAQLALQLLSSDSTHSQLAAFAFTPPWTLGKLNQVWSQGSPAVMNFTVQAVDAMANRLQMGLLLSNGKTPALLGVTPLVSLVFSRARHS